MLFGCSHCSFALLIAFFIERNNLEDFRPGRYTAQDRRTPMRFVLIAALALSVRRLHPLVDEPSSEQRLQRL
jgi:hypothetical protein